MSVLAMVAVLTKEYLSRRRGRRCNGRTTDKGYEHEAAVPRAASAFCSDVEAPSLSMDRIELMLSETTSRS